MEEALNFHKKFNFKGEVVETSSKSGINIEETFIKLGKEILQRSLIKCKHCGELFPQELIYCQFCGNKKD